jgi:CHAD domain-containing protein
MPTPTDGRSSKTRRQVAAPQATCEEAAFGEQPLWRVGGEALRTQLLRIRDSVTPVIEESGIEDIHEMRVASRRLRTMARVLEATPAFRRKRMTRLRKQFQPLASDLGTVRDLDILLERLGDYEHTSVESSQTSSPLHDTLQGQREKALSHLRKALQQPNLQKLLRDPDRTTERLLAHKQSAQRVLARHVAGDALWKRYEVILSFEEAVAAGGGAATEQLHALRIACKQLRYALELFSEDSDPCAQSLIGTLKEVQGHLGELQDSVFAVALLTQLRHHYPDDQLLEDFRATQEERQNTLRQDFAPFWERLSGSPYRRDLAALIAAL